VATVRTSVPVSSLRTTTVAPATTAPLGSVTVPVNVAASSWAEPNNDKLKIHMQTAKDGNRVRATLPSLLIFPHIDLTITAPPESYF
jgi:hypothetical protein